MWSRGSSNYNACPARWIYSYYTALYMPYDLASFVPYTLLPLNLGSLVQNGQSRGCGEVGSMSIYKL